MYEAGGKKYMIIHKTKTVGNKEGIDILCISGELLGTETVEGAARALESIDNIKSSDGLPAGPKINLRE